MKKYLIKVIDFIGLRAKLKQKIKWIKFEYASLHNNNFNKTVIAQNKNIKSIPIIIISFNQLLYLKKLIHFLIEHNYDNIVIIDNNSTYEPLLEYFSEIESSVRIHRLKQNYGHLVFWEVKGLYEMYSKGYYVITDADINPIPECPDDFLLYFKKILDKNLEITKVGFSLKIDDIPYTNIHKEKIVKWENRFWDERERDGNFIADIDTTFALYRPHYTYSISNFYKAYRAKTPYLARHGGWYIDNENLTEEQKFFFANCNKSSSWRIDEDGKINKKIYLE